MLKICESLIKKGHKIRGIFFFGTGVYNLKKDISSGASIRNIPEKIEKFCTLNKIPTVACSTWVSLTGLKEENFIEGATEEGLGDFSNWAVESDKLIIFGTGG
jgi:sulfur relay (sulfurtransferase) complex TusBCD TusD component (DsrE family)